MNLPLYKAKINGDDTGMFTISLVDLPAVESDFLMFNENKAPLQFKVENEEKRIITGVVMRCNHPIYRMNSNGFEYYVIFDESTLEEMAEKWLFDGCANCVNLNHQPDSYVSGVYLKELYFKDTERGINPKGFEDIEDKSLFGTYKVLNEDVWNSIKEGSFKGFSLEGVFDMEEVRDSEEDELLDELVSYLENEINKLKNK